MIWAAIVILVVVAVGPFAVGLFHSSSPRGRREAALTLHRAQLAELDRDSAEGRIAATEHASALLEVQRRLLAAAEDRDTPATSSSRRPLFVSLFVIPATALALYLLGGVPWLPSMTNDPEMLAVRREALQEAALIPILRERVASLDQHSEQAREGYMLLGGAEARQGNLAGAAEAWRKALEVRFDAALAVETAEAISESSGVVTEEAVNLFRRALAEAPPGAPWRSMAERRLSQMN